MNQGSQPQVSFAQNPAREINGTQQLKGLSHSPSLFRGILICLIPLVPLVGQADGSFQRTGFMTGISLPGNRGHIRNKSRKALNVKPMPQTKVELRSDYRFETPPITEGQLRFQPVQIR